MSDLTSELSEAFGEQTDPDTAETAAQYVGDFAEEYDEDLTAEAVRETFENAPYDEFVHAFNWLVGELAAEHEDCTDSRAFRIDGFGELAADPDMAA